MQFQECFWLYLKVKSGGVYNITDPRNFYTVKELAQHLFDLYNPKLYIEYDIQPKEKTGYLPHLEFTQNIDKLKKLGWKPITDLDDIYKIDLERFEK